MKSVKTRVAGIVLAAGCSSRMGRSKQLLFFQGKPLLAHVVSNALASDLDPVVVVLGHGASTIQKNVDLALARVVVNSDYASGQSSSLKKGLACVADCCDGAMFLLGDQPLVGHETINLLIQAFQNTLPPIVIPFYKGRRGNPVIIHGDLFSRINALVGDAGARVLFNRYADTLVAVEIEDAGVIFDVDTWDDFQRLKQLPRSRRLPRHARYLAYPGK